MIYKMWKKNLKILFTAGEFLEKGMTEAIFSIFYFYRIFLFRIEIE